MPDSRDHEVVLLRQSLTAAFQMIAVLAKAIETGERHDMLTSDLSLIEGGIIHPEIRETWMKNKPADTRNS
jgi:hypothetical protein